MKFFFCETCGKRLTDADLAAGQARDKQVKGIYCADCAQSVMTMEFGALKEEQARALLKDPPGTNAGPAPELPQHAPPNTVPVTTRRGARNSSTERLVPHCAQHKAAAEAATGIWITFVAGGAVLALGLVLYFAKASNSPSAPKNAPVLPVPVVESTPAPAALPERTSIPVPGPQAVAQAAPASNDAPPENAASNDADARARADFEALNRKLAELPAAALEQKKELAEAFLKAHGESLLASRVRVTMRGWETPPPDPARKEPAPRESPPAKPQPQPDTPLPPATNARIVVWDGKGIRGGATWGAQQEGAAEVLKAEHPDGTNRQALKLTSAKPGYCALGFNWHSWNPSAKGTDLSAASQMRLRIKIESASKPLAANVYLKAIGSDIYFKAPFDNPAAFTDGEWHDLVIPFERFADEGGAVLDRTKATELKFDLYREGQPTTVWIARIAFE
ncbi:MAG: hypothetical protein HS116_09245 [Planctomycetes bacterium]|nr:hypothetical protein [Planctomycetota bacterium]